MTKQEKDKLLAKIAIEIERCRVCKRDSLGLSVPGEGNASARVVFIGEAPGRTEAKIGRPFVGTSGKLLRRLIVSSGLVEADVYITSPVKRCPKKGTPTPAQIAHGKIHVDRQLAVIRPKVVVLLGRVAAFAVINKIVAVAKEHGKIINKNGIKFFLTFHPAAPLHSPKVRQELLKDFEKLSRIVKE